jgi:hypothetical protein
MEECLPKASRSKKTLISSNSSVKDACHSAQQAQRHYEASNSMDDKELWSQAVKNLYKVYELVEEE